MTIKYEDFLATLPDEVRIPGLARGQELIAEEASLRDIRESQSQSQSELADKYGVQQGAISKLERRTDMHVSTLRGLVQAMGGELDIIARFPDKPPVRINQFRALEG